jgi:hypothetical protein
MLLSSFQIKSYESFWQDFTSGGMAEVHNHQLDNTLGTPLNIKSFFKEAHKFLERCRTVKIKEPLFLPLLVFR